MAPELEFGAINPARFEILPDTHGAPRGFLDAAPISAAISLSHREGAALGVVTRTGSVGCDLEWIEPRSEAFVRDYFTAAERERIEAAGVSARELLANGLWSAKESLLKLLGVGLRIDTRSIIVESFPQDSPRDWRPLAMRLVSDGRCFTGWRRCEDNWILTVVADEATGCPIDC